MSTPDENEFSEFIASIKNGAEERVEQMLRAYHPSITNRIDPKLKQTSLFFAVVAPGQDTALRLISLLLEAGANPHFKDQNQQTVLFYACREGREQIIDRLLTAGLSLDEVDMYGQTPLFYAVSENRLNIIHRFNHSLMNHVDKLAGQTALYYAARKGHLEMCKKLISLGCQINVVDHLNKSAVEYARKAKFTQVAEYLGEELKRSKNINKGNSHSNHQQSMERKKKKEDGPKVVKISYKVVHMSEKGQTHDLTEDQLRTALKDRPQALNYFLHPELIPSEEMDKAQGDTWQKIALKIMNTCTKNNCKASWFMEPVDPVAFNILNYFDIIPHPMDLGTIKKKLTFNCYASATQFKNDVELVWNNCYRYNGEVHEISKCAKEVQTLFNEQFDNYHFEQYL